MKAIKVRLTVLLVVLSILTILTPTIVVGQACGDVDGNGSYSIMDFGYLRNYLWTNGPAPDNPEDVGLIDGYAGLTHNDLQHIYCFYGLGGPEPVCDEIHDSILTVADDAIVIRGGEVPPGVTEHKLDL
jgi:hypothetical protein